MSLRRIVEVLYNTEPDLVGLDTLLMCPVDSGTVQQVMNNVVSTVSERVTEVLSALRQQ